MPDVITQTSELKIENLFVDGDTRNFTLKNPKSTLTANDIATLSAYMQSNNALISDKWGGNFGRITTATRINKTTRKLDWNS